ncbi:MAG TPA: dienelactone hydrolase family protein [Candidatus Acidoferrum sp.]|nr:dienelactone hydrolase family protein [Candidatus Acidoferrum sp.]
MEIRSEYAQLAVNDGSTMRAWVARPKEEGSFPGLLVLQEAFGVNAHIRDIAGRFAREGYVAVAPELFHRTGAGFEGRYNDFPGVTPHMKALNDASMAADLRAAHDWLRGAIGTTQPISAIGYCMGGRAAFLAALTVPLAGAVSYYGAGIAPNATNGGLLGRVSGMQAHMLFFWGGRDRHISPEQVQAVTGALRAAGKNFVNVEISNADHGFFCDARPSYNPTAAALAWPLTLAFLRERAH